MKIQLLMIGEIKLQNIILYSFTIIFLFISFTKNKVKTKQALLKGWKSLDNILAPMLGIIAMVGIIIAFLNPESISVIIGDSSGLFGVLLASIIGSITLIPGFIAFPTAVILLQNGAGYMQLGAFISTLMMVGIMTIPIEKDYFGKKLTTLRNTSAFIFSFLVAFIIGKVMG